MATDKPSAPAERLGVPSRNPLPLSASQEAQVRDIYYARVRKNCTDEIKGTICHPQAQSPLSQLYGYGREKDRRKGIFTGRNDGRANIMGITNSIRRLRPRPDVHGLIRLPRRAPRDEWLHDPARHTGGARRRERGMVRHARRAPAAARAKGQGGGRAGGVHEGVVGFTRGGEAVETEGDGEERGESRRHACGSKTAWGAVKRMGGGRIIENVCIDRRLLLLRNMGE